MEVYIARQPIFDRNMDIYGYELLYRKNSNNMYTGIDDDQATAELICNSFLVFGINDLTDGTKAFINFSKGLINSSVPLLLPPNNVVVEILEREDTTQEIIDACKRMRSMGYMLALDDFILEDKFMSLMDTIDIVKVEFPSVNYNIQRNLIQKYKSKVKFLAEKIETREEYQKAFDLGYDLFQGYFFSKPFIMKTREIASLNSNLFSIIEELNKPEPSYKKIAEIIQNDLGLTYKILKLANSAYYGTKNKITSIHQALSYLGMNKIYQWVSLMMLKDFQSVENLELIKLSLIRGKLMDSLAIELGMDTSNSEYFFVGMFSFIDILLNKNMEEIIKWLPFTDNVKMALLGVENDQRKLLNCIINYESATLDTNQSSLFNKISSKRYMELYVDALKWASSLQY
ncbi:MAG: HDOD domain-containing protein [Anaerovorax sp.]|nr:HDOD domain-containing protein [Anaerovorax sp.]